MSLSFHLQRRKNMFARKIMLLIYVEAYQAYQENIWLYLPTHGRNARKNARKKNCARNLHGIRRVAIRQNIAWCFRHIKEKNKTTQQFLDPKNVQVKICLDSLCNPRQCLIQTVMRHRSVTTKNWILREKHIMVALPRRGQEEHVW